MQPSTSTLIMQEGNVIRFKWLHVRDNREEMRRFQMDTNDFVPAKFFAQLGQIDSDFGQRFDIAYTGESGWA
jgi:hypothetical protein